MSVSDPLISVIVPFYNMESFLAEAIESVLQQSYTHWELILINDNSTDKSKIIAQHYCNQYPEKIKCYMVPGNGQKPRGLTVARNTGVKNVNGTYIALLDADDYWLPQKLTEQVKIIHQHPECALIGGASLYWFSWMGNNQEDIVVPTGGDLDRVMPPPQAAYKLYPLSKGTSPCPCSLIIKTDVVKKYEGFEEQFSGIYQVYEDQAFLMKIYLHEKIYLSATYLDKYRQRPDSMVYKIHETGQYHKVRKFFLNWLADYLKTNHITDQKIMQLLKQAQFPYHHPIQYKLTEYWKKCKQYLNR